jgi:hypothetical protein
MIPRQRRFSNFDHSQEFAKQLFDLQTKKYGSKERKKELKKKNKGKENDKR